MTYYWIVEATSRGLCIVYVVASFLLYLLWKGEGECLTLRGSHRICCYVSVVLRTFWLVTGTAIEALEMLGGQFGAKLRHKSRV